MIMKIPYLYSITLMIALSVCTTKVLAQETASETKAEIVNNEMIGGEIRKIDKEAKKITIRHGEIKKLEMPPMTMVFQVKDEAFLNNIKTGDKVNFIAEKIGGAFVVTNIQVSN
jgi:Cu(I)/Ag(I) efflux system protein CusF